MICIVDYGVGNLFSLKSSLDFIGADCVISGDREVIAKSEKLILPGVGAFHDAKEKLDSLHLSSLIIEHAESKKPLLGICLGMQVLFSKSYENGTHKGLGIIEGDVVAFEKHIDKSYKIPHIGWNALNIKKPCVILDKLKDGQCVYFVHSYFAQCASEYIYADTEYGTRVPAVVGADNVFGCQFHPEKSGDVGLNILRSFCAFGNIK